jgi:hypothetical protein
VGTDLSNFRGVWWGLWFRLLRLVFLVFLSVPQGSHWYLKAGALPPPSTLIKINHFQLYIFCLCTIGYVLFWHRSITLVTSLNHKQVHASSQSEPTHTRGFLFSVTLPLKTNFNYHISAAVTDHVWRWPLCHLSIGYCCYCPSQTSNAFLLNIRGLTRGVPWRVLMDGETKWSERHVRIGVHHQWSNNIRNQVQYYIPLVFLFLCALLLTVVGLLGIGLLLLSVFLLFHLYCFTTCLLLS